MATTRPAQRRNSLEKATGVSGKFRGPARRSTPPASRYPSNAAGYRREYGRPNRNLNVAAYTPIRYGDKASGSVGGLEAEFLGGMLLIFLTVFTDQNAGYQDKLLAVMKRGTLLAVTFFILALVANGGPNSARFAKAFGAMIVLGIFLQDASEGFVTEFNTFIKSTWTSTGEPGSDSNSAGGSGSSDSAGAGQQFNVGGAIKDWINGLSKLPWIP